METNKIRRICELLDERYGRKEWAGREPVLDELILTILSQNTSAANYNEAFRRLTERFGTWEAAMHAPVEEIAEAIKVGGLANLKAPRIKAILEDIYERQGSLDLEWIADVPDSEALGYLLGFNGVGRKTAACVLMFALGRPVLPVDTHVHCVAARLGLIEDVSADKAHDLLQELVPPDDVYSFHINMVTHGRQVCYARRPACYRCVLRRESWRALSHPEGTSGRLSQPFGPLSAEGCRARHEGNENGRDPFSKECKYFAEQTRTCR